MQVSKTATENGGDLTQTEAHLYGSSRLGIYTLSRKVEHRVINTDGKYIFERGNKFFELSNHLGNVLVTVSDRKLQVSSNAQTVDYYTADVITATDYYPFGMDMPGRKFGGAGRYGFNGKEKDKDISAGDLDFGARIYDGRIGRWLSVDPLAKKYPNESPYIFSGNSPIYMIDRYGETKEIVHLQYDAKTGVYTVIKVVHKHGLKKVLTTEWQGSTNVYHYNFYDYQTYKVTVVNGEKGADYSKYTNLNDMTFGDSKYHVSGDGPFSTTGWAETRTGEWNPNYVRIPDESETQFNDPDRAAPIWLTGEMKIALIPLLNAIGQVGEPSEKKQIEINAVTTHIGRLEIQANAKKLNVELRSNKKETKYERNPPAIAPPFRNFLVLKN